MLFRHKFTKRRNAACHRKGGTQWYKQRHFLKVQRIFPDNVSRHCASLVKIFLFLTHKIINREECWMIASIRILVWRRRECWRNMLIRHWHFLFPPTTEIHTLKIYITLTHDKCTWPAHNIGNPRKRITDTSQSELSDTLSTIPKWGWGGIRLLIGERLQKGCERWQDVEAGADKMTPSKPWALTGVILNRSPSSRSSRSTM